MSCQAGTKATIIPDEALFAATIRSFSDRVTARYLDSCVQICESVAAAHGLTAEVTVSPGYPATVDDRAEFELAAETITELFGPDRIERWDDPIFGSEDFSRVLEAVPGAYIFLGACPEESYLTAATNHSPRQGSRLGGTRCRGIAGRTGQARAEPCGWLIVTHTSRFAEVPGLMWISEADVRRLPVPAAADVIEEALGRLEISADLPRAVLPVAGGNCS